MSFITKDNSSAYARSPVFSIHRCHVKDETRIAKLVRRGPGRDLDRFIFDALLDFTHVCLTTKNIRMPDEKVYEKVLMRKGQV